MYLLFRFDEWWTLWIFCWWGWTIESCIDRHRCSSTEHDTNRWILFWIRKERLEFAFADTIWILVIVFDSFVSIWLFLSGFERSMEIGWHESNFLFSKLKICQSIFIVGGTQNEFDTYPMLFSSRLVNIALLSFVCYCGCKVRRHVNLKSNLCCFAFYWKSLKERKRKGKFQLQFHWSIAKNSA